MAGPTPSLERCETRKVDSSKMLPTITAQFDFECLQRVGGSQEKGKILGQGLVKAHQSPIKSNSNTIPITH